MSTHVSVYSVYKTLHFEIHLEKYGVEYDVECEKSECMYDQKAQAQKNI